MTLSGNDLQYVVFLPPENKTVNWKGQSNDDWRAKRREGRIGRPPRLLRRWEGSQIRKVFRTLTSEDSFCSPVCCYRSCTIFTWSGACRLRYLNRPRHRSIRIGFQQNSARFFGDWLMRWAPFQVMLCLLVAFFLH